MERIRRLVLEANNAFRIADHLACVAYPLLTDNKILPTIANQLYIASLNGIAAVLYYEKMNKRISILPLDFESRIEIFRTEVASNIGISPEFFKIVKDLGLIVKQHKDSPVEFSRREKFVICGEGYETISSIDIVMLKSYIDTVRRFLLTVSGQIQNV